MQGVDRFAALLGEEEIFVILLCPPEPFQLHGGHGQVDAEPFARVEPDQFAGVGGLIGRVGGGKRGVPEDEILLELVLDVVAEKRQPGPDAGIVFVAAGADVGDEAGQIGAEPVTRDVFAKTLRQGVETRAALAVSKRETVVGSTPVGSAAVARWICSSCKGSSTRSPG